MAATSPYTNNDYQAVSNFRPYELPINDIFKGLTAQNEFWEAGARKVKAIYDTALNLDLTLEANREVRKKFMDDANKQLDRLSSMDLSDPSVQRQGFNIYKPLLQDKAIMFDNELTKTMKGIYSDAEMYKKKKLSSTGAEGEGYTDRNLAYSLDGFENFNSKTPRDAALLQDLYGKLGKKQFSPYYNPTQEYASILKNCKGSGGEKQDVASNYMYFDSFSKTGANSSETSNCFMMGLSEKAKQQIGIDGWAYYRSNPQLLADDHREFALGRQEAQLKAIQGKIEGIKAGGVGADEKAKLKELEDLLPSIQQEYDNRRKEYDNMVGGDALNYVQQNFQTLSRGIYLSKNYAALGEAFKSDETSRKLTANAAGIAQFNAIEKARENELDRQAERDNIYLRATLSRKLKQEAGEIPLDNVNPLDPMVTEADDTNQTYNTKDFNNDKETAFGAYSNAYQTLTSYILSKNPNIDRKAFSHEFILNFANEQSKKPKEQQDKQFVELMAAYNTAKDGYSTLDMRGKAIDQIVYNNLSKEHQDKLEKTITLSDGTKIKAKDIGTIRKSTTSPGSIFVDGQLVKSNLGATTFTVNGKVYDKPLSEDFVKLSDLAGEYDKVYSSGEAEKDKLHRKTYYEAQGFLSPRLNPAKNPGIENQIKNILGVTGGNNEKNGYKLIGHDRTGKDLIVIPLDENGNETKVDLVRAMSLNVNVKEQRIGKSINALRIPNMLSELADVPTPEQQSSISGLRDFQVLMESQLRNKGSYYSSENLKNSDGTTFAYPTYSFKTPRGTNIKVKAVIANGQTKLIPATQTKSGDWDDNYQSFNTAEDLVLYFRTY